MTARQVGEALARHGGLASNFALSQVMQSFFGRFHMEPRGAAIEIVADAAE